MKPIDPPRLPVCPAHVLRERLLAYADALQSRRLEADATELRELVARWSVEQEGWVQEVSDLLSIHHEINNALVGVRGNAQLLMMGPAAQHPGVRDRLEVVVREATRIQEAAVKIHGLKSALIAGGGAAHAA